MEILLMTTLMLGLLERINENAGSGSALQIVEYYNER